MEEDAVHRSHGTLSQSTSTQMGVAQKRWSCIFRTPPEIPANTQWFKKQSRSAAALFDILLRGEGLGWTCQKEAAMHKDKRLFSVNFQQFLVRLFNLKALFYKLYYKLSGEKGPHDGKSFFMHLIMELSGTPGTSLQGPIIVICPPYIKSAFCRWHRAAWCWWCSLLMLFLFI